MPRVAAATGTQDTYLVHILGQKIHRVHMLRLPVCGSIEYNNSRLFINLIRKASVSFVSVAVGLVARVV